MKTTHLLLLVLIGLQFHTVAQVQSTCNIPLELEAYYKYDVADLTLNRMFTTKSPDTTLITIPSEQLDSIWRGLAAIFNASAIPERDSVFDIHCIHNSSYKTKMLLPHIYIVLDPSVSWTSNWFNGEIITGYSELDNFISNYQYSIFSADSNYGYVVIYSEQIVNPFAVSDSLVFFDGIETAEPYPMIYDGNKIQYNVDNEYQYFTFTLSWGDCPSGCIYNHNWRFRVHYSDCIVEYLGLETNADDNFPNPINCNITPVEETEFYSGVAIYPTPFTTSTTIEHTLTKPENVHITIYNVQGQMVFSMQEKRDKGEQKIQWNTEGLPAGMYHLRIQTGNRIGVGKME